MAAENQEFFQDLSFELMEELNIDLMQLAAGVLCLAQIARPLRAEKSRALANPRWDDPKPTRRERGPSRNQPLRNMVLYRIAVGSSDGVEVRNIVGAVANETGLGSRFIGQIRIHPHYSTIELPHDVPQDMLDHLKGVRVGGKPMRLSRIRNEGGHQAGRPNADSAPRTRKPKKTKAESATGAKPRKPKKPKKPKLVKGKPKPSKSKAGKSKSDKSKPGKSKPGKSKAKPPKKD